MIAIPHKTKQFLLFVAKLFIVSAAFYFIYHQLVTNEKLDWNRFIVLLQEKQSIAGILFILSFSFFNRFFEILKWQNLASVIAPITLGTATKQVLGALTAGVFTPNGLGEYAGKALYYDKKMAKRVVFLNLICNGVQMLLTVVFGVLGLLFLGFWIWVFGILSLLVFLGLIYFLFKEFTVKGYSLQGLLFKINEIPKKVHRKNLLLGFCRYMVFSHQYYVLFLVFDVHLPYFTLIATIAAVYFLASSLPTFQFLDFAVKGSVAMYFFGNLGVNEWVVVFISTLMWFLNIVLPVLLGSYFVMRFTPKWKQ